MPRRPPGIGRREVYSEELENVGSLIEKHYKQYQLDDVAHLHNQAEGFLNRCINNIKGNTRIGSSQGNKDCLSRSPSCISLNVEEQKQHSTLESVGNTPSVTAEIQGFEEDATPSLGFSRLKTKVVLDIPVFDDAPTSDGKTKSLNTEADVSCINAISNKETSPPDESHLGVIQASSICSEPDTNITLTIQETQWDIHSDVNSKGAPIRYICIVLVVIHGFLSLLSICLFWFTSHKLQSCGYNLTLFTIIYPFVAYFIFEVFIVFVFECILTRYILTRHIPLSLVVRTEIGFSKCRVVDGLVNNGCLLLAIATALFPHWGAFESLNKPQSSAIYYSGLFLVHLASTLALYLHCRRITADRGVYNILVYDI